MTKNGKKSAENFYLSFFGQKLHFKEKPSKKEHPALQIIFINFFLFLGVICALLDPDPTRNQIRIRIHNTAKIL
jgi:hypothetical protein